MKICARAYEPSRYWLFLFGPSVVVLALAMVLSSTALALAQESRIFESGPRWEPPIVPQSVGIQPLGPSGGLNSSGLGQSDAPTVGVGGGGSPPYIPPVQVQRPSAGPIIPKQIDLVSDLVGLPACRTQTRPNLDVDGDLLYDTGFQFITTYTHNAGLPGVSGAASGVNVALDATLDQLKVGVDESNDDTVAQLLIVDRRSTELKYIINLAKSLKDSYPAKSQALIQEYYRTIRVNLANDSKMGVPQFPDNGNPCRTDLRNCSARFANMFAFIKHGMSQDETIKMHRFEAGTKSVLVNLIGNKLGDKGKDFLSGLVRGPASAFTQRLMPTILPRTMSQAQWKLTSQLTRAATYALRELAGDSVQKVFKRTVDLGTGYAELYASRRQDPKPCYDVHAIVVAAPAATYDTATALFPRAAGPIALAAPMVAIAAIPARPAPLPAPQPAVPAPLPLVPYAPAPDTSSHDTNWTRVTSSSSSTSSSGSSSDWYNPDHQWVGADAVHRVYQQSEEHSTDCPGIASCHDLQQIEATTQGIPKS